MGLNGQQKKVKILVLDVPINIEADEGMGPFFCISGIQFISHVDEKLLNKKVTTHGVLRCSSKPDTCTKACFFALKTQAVN
jgi:hypothetical protein